MEDKDLIIETGMTAVVKSAEEITGIKGCSTFAVDIAGDIVTCTYITIMNKLAGKRIQLEAYEGRYDYSGAGYSWLSSWLKDFKGGKKTIDVSRIPVDYPVLVRDDNSDSWVARHFAEIIDGQIYCYSDGCTSWTAGTKNPWSQLALPSFPDIIYTSKED